MSSMPHQTQTILIPGPCGQLEALLSTPIETDTATACGVICHPNPQQAGTMDNKVVTTLHRAMESRGWITLRFNYRGVGQSDGEYGHEVGEIQDGLAVADWLQEKFPSLPLHIAGFSFGAFIAASMARQISTPSLVTIAPVVTLHDFVPLAHIETPWLGVVGDQDELVSSEQIQAFCEQTNCPMQLKTAANATHFFHGQLIQLRELVTQFYQDQSK